MDYKKKYLKYKLKYLTAKTFMVDLMNHLLNVLKMKTDH